MLRNLRTLDEHGLRRADARPIDVIVSAAPVDYRTAEAVMTEHAAAVRNEDAPERIWFLEHPPVYTAGTSADPAELRDPNRFPVHKTGRGGRFTYHGPGQRVVYLMLDLAARRKDVRAYVGALESAVIAALADLDVEAHTAEDRVGVWTKRPDGGEDKIAAIGVRIKRWVSMHGASINVAPDLGHFAGIVPCGLSDGKFGVTSLDKLGIPAADAKFDSALLRALDHRFGPLSREGEVGGP